MIQRRSFIAGILTAGMAPAIVRAGSLMKIVAPQQIWTMPEAYWDFPRLEVVDWKIRDHTFRHPVIKQLVGGEDHMYIFTPKRMQELRAQRLVENRKLLVWPDDVPSRNSGHALAVPDGYGVPVMTLEDGPISYQEFVSRQISKTPD